LKEKLLRLGSIKDNMKEKLLVGLLFVLLLSSANAHYIDRHLIQVNVADDGSSKVTEKFFLAFVGAADLANFRKKAIENGSSIDNWAVFDGNIASHIGTIKSGTGRILFEDKETERFVTLEYEPNEKFMLKKSEGSRKIDWEINSNIFSSFEAGSVYVIPNNADISIVLPKAALLETETIVPAAVVSGNIVSWSGPINISGKLILNYSTEKQIAPTISISKTLQDFVASGAMPITIITIAIVLALAYWKREAISERIEAYVVEHSKLESKPGKIEEELE
jgi:hypothetical protein